MKVLWQGFAAKNHSWSIIAQNICRQLISLGHDVHIFSTNGLQFFPNDLKSNLIGYTQEDNQKIFGRLPDNNYDAQLTYTALRNFPNYLCHGSKNRIGIWTYEFSGKNSLPTGFAKNYKSADWILPPSQFAKKVFVDSGIPESVMKIIPHGINKEEILMAEPIKLKTKKNFKIFVNVAQIHRRKNLSGLLEMYGKAFTKNDDVCLIIKAHEKKPTQPFELDFNQIMSDYRQRYKNSAEIEVIKEFIPNIYSLYKSCDACFSASHTEAFGMTALEAQATGLFNIAPRYGGFLDFLNDDNSLLIEGKEFFVKPDMIYWSYQPGSKAFMPDVDSGVQQLRLAYSNKNALKKKASELAPQIINDYSWKKVTSQILGLIK